MRSLKDQVQALLAQQPALEGKVADLLKQQAKKQEEELLRVHSEQMQSIKDQAQVLAAQQPSLETALAALLKQQAEQQSKQQTDELLRVRRYLENLIKSNSANTTRQVQSFIGMQEYLATGSLPAFNSQSHSWPVSSDFALFLMQRVVLEQYDLIVEFGSGMSTVLLAKTLATAAERTGNKPPRFVSFDHLERYYNQTKDHLDQAGLGESVDLVLAPLAEWKGLDGAAQDYYDCRKKLNELARSKSPVFKRILVIVDGPPASTGPQARYPAGPIIADSFPKAHIDFVLDDYIREDEKETAQRWLSELKLTEVPGALTEYKFEKDACLITVHPKDTK
jgi:predicted O-methyltransferase YrrM